MKVIVKVKLDRLVVDCVFPDTGEIRRKNFTWRQFVKRLLQSELRTWQRRGDEIEIEQVQVDVFDLPYSTKVKIDL